jgi:hypothetical protein
MRSNLKSAAALEVSECYKRFSKATPSNRTLPISVSFAVFTDGGRPYTRPRPWLRDTFELALTPDVGLEPANTPSMSRNALPAAVLVSIGCSVALRLAPLPFTARTILRAGFA